MDERAALARIADLVPAAGDDAAVVGETVVTIDMLHDRTDFPAGTTRYTQGWRSVGASLSDVAAMGAEATGAVAVYGSPSFDPEELEAFVRGASDVCDLVGAEYVGGDLDDTDEFITATTAIGEVETPVHRSGARPGDAVCVTGELGRSAAAVDAFEAGDVERGNDLFRFSPRVAAGRALAPHATAMMDSSDGLARSLHQLAEASDCGFSVERDRIPLFDGVDFSTGTTFGEDFELVCTLPAESVDEVETDVPLSVVGEVTESDVLLDGDSLADEGYTH